MKDFYIKYCANHPRAVEVLTKYGYVFVCTNLYTETKMSLIIHEDNTTGIDFQLVCWKWDVESSGFA